jgi:hypothetical protein
LSCHRIASKGAFLTEDEPLKTSSLAEVADPKDFVRVVVERASQTTSDEATLKKAFHSRKNPIDPEQPYLPARLSGSQACV